MTKSSKLGGSARQDVSSPRPGARSRSSRCGQVVPRGRRKGLLQASLQFLPFCWKPGASLGLQTPQLDLHVLFKGPSPCVCPYVQQAPLVRTPLPLD